MKNYKKKINKISAFFLTILLMSMLLAPAVFASARNFVDNAGLLHDEEELEYIANYMEKVSERLQFDIVVVTTEGYDQDNIVAFADDFFENNGYGYGEDKDGIIFAVDMLNGEYVLTTSGSGIYAITDEKENQIYDSFEEDLIEGLYSDAFTTGYTDAVASIITEYSEELIDDEEAIKTGDGADGEQGADKKANIPGIIGISAVIGLVAGALSSFRHKSALKTVRREVKANNYARKGSMVLTKEKDSHLYTKVDAKSKDKSKKTDSEGGTTVHKSSSGKTHGGGQARSI